MDETTEPHQIFFTNLLLMGFDPVVSERKDRIPFNKDMFVLPNKKGFETVMHFMFHRLDPVHCREEFRDCWPVTDKKQEQQFRKVCHNWLSNIAQEDPDAHLPRIVASLFLSPGGERFYELLVHCSAYVVLKTVLNEHGAKHRDFLQRPILTPANRSLGPTMGNMVKCGVVRHRKKLIAQAQQTVVVQEQWKEYAGELVKSHRALTKKLRELERQVRAEQQRASDQGSLLGSPVVHKKRSAAPGYDYDIQSVKRAQKVQKVRALWKTLEEFITSKEEERAIIDSILEGTLEKYRIDATELDVKVPGLLLRECEREIQRRNVDNIYHGGKLNMLSLVHLWNLCLHLYIEKIHQVGVPNFEDAVPTVTTQVHTHHAHLANAKALRQQLEQDMIPQLKASIETLKKKLDSQLFSALSPDSIRTTSIGLGLVPLTPPVSFDPNEAATPGNEVTMPRTNHFTDKVSTPDAAAELIEAVSRKVRDAHQSTVVQGSPVYAPKLGLTSDLNTHSRPSRVPIRGKDVQVEVVGNKQRTRFKAVISPLAEPAPRETPSPEHTVKVTGSGTTLQDLSAQHSRDAKQSLTAQVDGQRDKQVFKVPKSAATKPPRGRRKHHSASASVQRHTDTVASFTNTPKAHKILADQVAEAVMAVGRPLMGTEHDEYDIMFNTYQAPVELDETAFASRDKLSRTPQTARQQRKTWHDVLLQDSVGPLSSTRIELARQPINKSDVDRIATKLFSPEESDTEDNIINVEAVAGRLREIETAATETNRVTMAMGRLPSPPPSSISSISPGSQSPVLREGRERHSTLLGDLSGDLLGADALAEELQSVAGGQLPVDDLLSLGIATPGGAAATANDLENDLFLQFGKTDDNHRKFSAGSTNMPRDGSLGQLMSHKGLFNMDTPSHTPDSSALRMSLGGDPQLQLQPTGDLYQSLLETQTPMLPTKTRAFLAEERHLASAPGPRPSPVKGLVYNTTERKDGVGGPSDANANNSARVHSPPPSRNVLLSEDSWSPAESKSDTSSSAGDHQSSRSGSRSLLDPEEESVRVIEFQNGLFNEYLDQSPSKARMLSSSIRLESSARGKAMPHNADSDARLPKSHVFENGPSTDSLIARYNKIKQSVSTTGEPLLMRTTPDHSPGRPPVQGQEAVSDKLAALSLHESLTAKIGSPSLGLDKYLQHTPVKDDASKASKKFALDFDDYEDGANRQAEPKSRLRGKDSPGVRKSMKNMFDTVEQGSSFIELLESEDQGLLNDSPPSLTSPGLELDQEVTLNGHLHQAGSIPMSPLTDAVHREEDRRRPHQPQRKANNWDDFDNILSEDASILLPASPADDGGHAQVKVARLLDL